MPKGSKNKASSNHPVYAIVDIETTGGSVSNSRITEIAIICHDGEGVVQRWSSLVNPEMDIPLHITALTGISNEMVAQAPTFETLAPQIFEWLHDKVFVAHNVNFDYSFIRAQLTNCGFTWDVPKLCTVRLSRKLLPGFSSYSLGKLCDHIGIGVTDRHRALGDAEATAQLFSILLAKDEQQLISGMLRRASPEQRLPAHVPLADFQALPSGPGVYYFHNQEGKVIYVGKAINLKKRVASHFVGHNEGARRQHFLKEIYGISFERCGSELMALLFECTEIQRLWPIYNRALKGFEPKFGLYHYVAVNGYGHLAVGRLPKQFNCAKVFHREVDGLNFLASQSKLFEIDQRFCRYGKGPVFKSDETLPDLEVHNSAIEKLLETITEEQPSFMLLDGGREANEQGCIWIEKGEFYGMGYLSAEQQLLDTMAVKDCVTRLKGNHYMLQLVMSHAQRYPQNVRLIS